MTYEEVLEMAKKLGRDVLVDEFEDEDEGKEISLTLVDFEGFDDDWREVFRQFDDPKGVDDLMDTLGRTALEVWEDYYTDYIFEDFSVRIKCASGDI